MKFQRILLVSTLFLAACTSVGRDYEAPVLELPTKFAAAPQLTLNGDVEARWWERLDDSVLASLVERALAGNLDLKSVLARLERARALRGVAASDRLPTVDARASYEHREESETTPFGQFIPRTDIHSLGIDAGWEPDLWGRVRRSIEAADGELAASENDVRAVAVALAAEVARAYVEHGSSQRRLEIAKANVALQQRTYELVKTRVEAGLVGPRDAAQASASLEGTRARLPALEANARIAANRLAVLLGLAPGELDRELAAARNLPRIPEGLVVGLPADLLRRRPDIVAAERRYAAEVARIGVAEAELYPRLVLSGTVGIASNGPEELFDGDSGVFGIGPSLRWNLFDRNRARGRAEAQAQSAEIARNAWEQAVLHALEETENALVSFEREQERRGSLEVAAGHARRAVELAQTQYREGLSDFQAVVDSQRIVAGLEDDLAASDAAIATHLIALYKALGGGFETLEDVRVASTAR
jgi:NodT family efflux transporter outer membrane factor (OMF) lipoprotein